MNLGQTVIVTAKPRAIDPRLFQIATLASLLVLGIWRFELAAGLPQIAITVSSSLLTQALFCRWQHKRFDPLSPLVTGLSLSLLLRTHDAVLWLAAPAIAISAKYIIRINHKHLFNPACIAIVTLLLTTHSVWVVPGQWGALAWGAAALAMAASLVLVPTGRIDVAVAFLAGWALLLAARCLWLGDPWTIPLHQMQSGVLLIFACFMLTDPRSTPDSVGGRVLFALAVAVLGYWFQFGWQVREGLFYALAIVSVSTPLLDRLLPAGRFQWTIQSQEV